jgi:hypothetical protein
MAASLTAPRSSKAKGWKLVALAVVVLAVLYAVFDLGSQFRLREAVRQIASAASHAVLQRPERPPAYRHVAGEDQARGAAQDDFR